MIVGFVGFIGCGKDTAADYLVNFHGFRRDSFANTLKDAVASIFGWDRTLLEGRTNEARVWREQVDTWWAEKLEIPYLTPRWVLQYWGTDVLRNNFHNNIWIASLENKLRKTKDNIVISDVRFPNEIDAIKQAGGIIVRIKRGADPNWFVHAEILNQGPGAPSYQEAKEYIEQAKIHASEYSWVGSKVDYEITNDGAIDDLFQQIKRFLPNKLPDHIKVVLDLI